MSEKAFTAGETEQVGDCGKWAAYIDDQSHRGPNRSAWYSRIRVLGSTEQQAADLRDEVLDALNGKPEAVAWNGEGLPPVGTVCEWRSSGTLWKKCRIVGHDGGLAVLVYEDTNYFARYAKDLRPIKTAEQIAEEERQREISEIHCELVSMAMSEDDAPKGTGEDWQRVAEFMHEKGYRKQVAP